jgi:hypothetical protein
LYSRIEGEQIIYRCPNAPQRKQVTPMAMPVVTLQDRSLAVRPLWRADEAHSVCGADQRDKKDAVAFGITVIACFGIAPVPRFLIELALKKGSLKTLTAHLPARTRALIEFLVRELHGNMV